MPGSPCQHARRSVEGRQARGAGCVLVCVRARAAAVGGRLGAGVARLAGLARRQLLGLLGRGRWLLRSEDDFGCISGPLFSCRGPQSALNCSCHCDGVTRDGPVALRVRAAETSTRLGGPCPPGWPRRVQVLFFWRRGERCGSRRALRAQKNNNAGHGFRTPLSRRRMTLWC